MAASEESFVSYRWATAADYDTLAQIMYDAIHAQPSPYTVAQQNAWCPRPPSGPRWHDALSGQDIAVVAVGSHLSGMATLQAGGYLDLVFLLPAARGQGHLRRLMEMVKNRAVALGLSALTTHASLSAEAPFAALGFQLLHHETVQRSGQDLPRALMRLPLETAGPDGAIR